MKNLYYPNLTGISKILVFCFFVTSVSGCHDFRRRYDNAWNQRLSDADKFNSYLIANHGSIHFKNLKLSNYHLEGMKVKSLIIENSSLVNFKAHNASIGRLVLKDSDFDNVKMHYSHIGDLVIENSELQNVELGFSGINQTILKNSNFTNCSIEIDSKKGLIQKSFIKNSTFSGSKFSTLEILKTQYAGNKKNYFGYTKIDSLLIKDSSLNVEFQESEIKETLLENVSGNYAGFLRISGDTFLVRDSELEGLTLGGTFQLNQFKSINSKYSDRISMSYAKINEVTITNCIESTKLTSQESVYNKFIISNCDLDALNLRASKIGLIHLKNLSVISKLWLYGACYDMKIDEFVLENVLIDGIFSMKHAQIKTLKTENLTKGKNLDIDYEGANFRL